MIAVTVQRRLPEELEALLDINTAAAQTQLVHHPLLKEHRVELYIKRDDLLHPIISGNKWRKLKYTLLDALNLGYDHIISMGGAWSNHLHALAWIGDSLNIKTTGLVRGEPPAIESPSLQDMRDWGMQIKFVDRQTFRELRRFSDYDSEPGRLHAGYWIPEGGASSLAMQGIAELLHEMDDADTICVCCGTGTTLAGLVAAANVQQRFNGFSALAAEHVLEQEVSKLLGPQTGEQTNWNIIYDYHFGGFAKSSPELNRFIDDFEQQTGIPLEPIYTGKMLFGLFDMIVRGRIRPGEKLIAIHSGGLQGKRDYN